MADTQLIEFRIDLIFALIDRSSIDILSAKLFDKNDLKLIGTPPDFLLLLYQLATSQSTRWVQ